MIRPAPQDGASQLAGLAKSFAGAGITNRTIAVFDNDTAAHEAAKQLEKASIPANIRTLHYPDIHLLKKYPTIGPGGLVALNVNGLAGSIELHFEADVLRKGKGFLPVQWRGFSEGMKKYHGEVMQNGELLTACNDRVARCRKDAGVLGKTDWSGIDEILQRIFHAFDR